MSRRAVVSLAIGVLAAVAGGATWAIAGRGSSAGAADTTVAPAATATIKRRDLVQHETVDGTLGYRDDRPLYGQGTRTVTGLRTPGAVVRRGEALYWVDDRPVVLLYGSVPMWRRLDAAADDGVDIRQLERNLVVLGEDPDGDIDVDGDWDSATTAAVKRWEHDRGLPETGAVEPGQLVFLPGACRIGEIQTALGALLQPGAELMDTTSTRTNVTVDLDADKQSLVRTGDSVSVELPDGRSVRGRITSVGKVAEAETDPETGEQGDPTIELTIGLAQGSKTGDFDEAPVEVEIAKDRAKHVLTVPTSALLALVEGGFAVEVVGADGVTHLVRVEPGIFADALVEISGRGLWTGMRVVVPA